MRHHHEALRKDEDKRAGKHKFKQGSTIEMQSRKMHNKPEEEQKVGMPPRRKKPVTSKPSPTRMGRKAEGTNDQSLKGRLTRILSTKTDECTWVLPKPLLIEWGRDKRHAWAESVALIFNSGLIRHFSVPPIAKMGDLKAYPLSI